MNLLQKRSVKVRYWFIIFMIYAVFGWLYEVFLEVVVYQWGFSNRGLLMGPYCPIYGVGAFAFIFTIYRFISKKDLKEKLIYLPLVFVFCMGLATGIELIASYLCEFITGSWPWQTYRDYKFNFQGRIALSPSLRFGLGGILFLYFLQPSLEIFMDKLGSKKQRLLSNAIFVVVMVDSIHFIIKCIS